MFRRPLVVRRRGAPLLRAAAIGGTAFALGRAGARSAQRQAASAQQEAEQDAAIADLQSSQSQTAGPAPAPAGAGGGIASQLQELASMRASGILSDEEFEAAKAKLLAT